MPKVHFTHTLQRHVRCESQTVAGATVGEALAHVFEANPGARGYILDDQGAVRRHVMVFVDGEAIRDPVRLNDALGPDSEVYVMQALSGG